MGGDRAYVATFTSFYIIDGHTGQPTFLDVGAVAHEVAISGDGRVLYAGKTVKSIAIAPNGRLVYVAHDPDDWAFRIDASANVLDGKIPLTRGPLSVIDTSVDKVTATIDVYDPAAIAFTADSAYAYVTNASSDRVSVIDTKQKTVTQTIRVGSEPRGIAIGVVPDTSGAP